MSRRNRVAVVGGGIGGLAAATDLARRGAAVTLFERADRVGGKMVATLVDGRPVDSGPTVLTMRWIFDRLFADAGRRLDDYVTLRRSEILARHHWPDGSRLDIYDDPDATAEAIEAFAGSREAKGFRRLLEHAARIFASVEEPFILSPQHSFLSMVRTMRRRGITDIGHVDFHRSMWRALGNFFRDPRLRQLFGRFATYQGSSPFETPATINLVAHVEHRGVWLVEGGIQRLAHAVARLAVEQGVEIRCGEHVDEILVRRGGATGLRLAGGETVLADAVVFNGDPAALSAGLLGEGARRAVERSDPGRRSLSALTWSLVSRTRGFPLVRHNVFFSEDYRAEFKNLLRHHRLASSPTVYVCAHDRGDRADPTGEERLLVLVNAPARGDLTPLTDEEVIVCQTRVFQRLQSAGLTIERRPEQTVVTRPRDFEQRFPGTGGAIYGQLNHGWRASFTRPGNRSRIPGLYLAGGAVHPGAGMPMATMAGRLAARLLLEDYPSISRSDPAVTPGGTPTSSPTIGDAR